MPPYDPEVIEQFAARLERRAVAVRRGLVATGAALGAAVGAVPLTPLHIVWNVPHSFGIASMLVGLVIGGLIGWVVGDGRAELHRLHAQTTLCQLHAQRTSLAIWRLLEQKHEQEQRVPVPTPAPAVAAAPAPAPAPAPVAVAPAEPEPLPEILVAPVREAVRLASVPAPPPALRPAGALAPPITPPPLTG